MKYIAFLGTGECDPNKTNIEILTFIALIVIWAIVIVAFSKLNNAPKRPLYKSVILVTMTLLAIYVTIGLIFNFWVGTLCN